MSISVARPPFEPALPSSSSSTSMSSPAPKKPLQPWLNAWTDPVSNLHAFSPCVRLADISADGEHRLLVADADKKLKVFKGTSLQSEHALMERPSALECYYSDQAKPQLPNIAIACGSAVYIYRNMRPYYKFALPPVPLDDAETAVWDGLRQGTVEPSAAIQALSDAKENGIVLSPRSLSLLLLTDPSAQLSYLSHHASLAYTQLTVVVCMATIHKSQSNDGSISQLIIGTEAGTVLILEPNSSSVHKTFTLSSTPCMMAVDGQLDIDYRIVIACRDGLLYTIKKGKLLGSVLQMESLITGLAILDKVVYVSCMDACVHAYSFKGKKLFTISVGCGIAQLDVLHLKKVKNLKLLIVATTAGQVHLYHRKQLLSTLQHDPLQAVRFGQYGREDATLALISSTGALSLKILQRSASFDTSDALGPPPPPPEQDIPLKVPKKTKLYVEQTQREREHCVDMHRIFQRDLCRMRLSTARAYVKVIQEGVGPLSSVGGLAVKLDARVQGLGPLFKLRLGVRNVGTRWLMDVPVMVVADEAKYRVGVGGLRIPCLVPGVEYAYVVDVWSVDPNGAADVVKVFVMNPKSAIPAIAAVVNMPVSEAEWE